MRKLIKKILKESYEDYAFQDIMSNDKSDPNRVKYEKMLKHIESPESDEGEEWSKKERDFLRKSLGKTNVPGYKEIGKDTQYSNELKTTLSRAETTLNKVKSILNSDSHKSENGECKTKLMDLSDDLNNVMGSHDDDLLNGKGIKIINSLIKEIDETVTKCNFLYKNR